MGRNIWSIANESEDIYEQSLDEDILTLYVLKTFETDEAIC